MGRGNEGGNLIYGTKLRKGGSGPKGPGPVQKRDLLGVDEIASSHSFIEKIEYLQGHAPGSFPPGWLDPYRPEGQVTEESTRAAVLRFLLERSIFSAPDAEYPARSQALGELYSPPENGFSFYPFPVTVRENGDVLDPDGDVIDHLDPEKTPNLIIALQAMQAGGVSQHKPGHYLAQELLDNETIDAAYKESQHYQHEDGTALIDKSKDGSDHLVSTPAGATANLRTLRDTDGNIILMRYTSPSGNTVSAGDEEESDDPHVMTRKEYGEALVAGLSMNTKANDLSGLWFVGENFDNRDFSSVNFNGAQLEGASFQGSGFSNFSLNDAYVQGADLTTCSLHKGSIEGTDMSDIKGERLLMELVDASGIRVSNSNLSAATIKETGMDDIHLNNVSLDGAKIVQSELSDATIISPSLAFTTFDNVHAPRLQAKGFVGSPIIKNSLFTWADMPGSSFGTDKSQGVYSSMEIEPGHISNSSFKEANLVGSSFVGIKPNAESPENGKDNNFSGANMSYANFVDCVSEGSDYSNTNFTGSTFKGTSFKTCIMSGAKFVDVDVAGVVFEDTLGLDLTGARNIDQAIVRKSSYRKTANAAPSLSAKPSQATSSTSSTKKRSKRQTKAERIKEIKDLHSKNPDISNAEMAQTLGVSTARISQLRGEAGIPGKRGRPRKKS
jgi:uncharacterized protein YjbI with pentapeptide repeats